MKLSCLPVSFFSDIAEGRMPVAEWATMAAEIGLDAIDLSFLFVLDRTPPAVRRLREQIERAGMRVTMVTSYPDFTHPDEVQRARELALELDVVRVAEALGARYVRATAGQAHPETGVEDGKRWATEGLTQLVEKSRDRSVTIVYENHAKPGPWQYTDFSQPPEIFKEIVERTEGTGLGVNFDTGNAASFADDPVQLLDDVIDRVVSVHAADTAVHGHLEHVLLGTGITPFPDLFARLKQAGWDGWICMEEASGQGRAGVAAAARYIRETWDRVEE